MDFLNYDYLQQGNGRQQKAYQVIEELQVMSRLAPYHPVLAGTIPLNIDIPASDLDIICEVHDAESFALLLDQQFGACDKYNRSGKVVAGMPRMVARFSYSSFWLEIFGQPLPVTKQNAYRHMVIEHRLLELAGNEAAEAIRQLKKSGLKTEPAFAEYFGLAGDPYQALLDMADWEDTRLALWIREKERRDKCQ
ncbi:DUF4269 domain-containing protein [Paenibacillus sanguinis]|uniref:DUF4269 domain-containing protein n=1 Tax=Paenibacillus sanguinis TaxID=225906 RepID=UPI0003603AFF|nr:DUF4269 domain-containing protein [Paenibacillus sanguinis]